MGDVDYGVSRVAECFCEGGSKAGTKVEDVLHPCLSGLRGTPDLIMVIHNSEIRVASKQINVNFSNFSQKEMTMKVIVFGATGMVGSGVLRECLLASDVELVLTVGRKATGIRHEKLQEIVQGNLFDLTAIESDLLGYDACFY